MGKRDEKIKEQAENIKKLELEVAELKEKNQELTNANYLHEANKKSFKETIKFLKSQAGNVPGLRETIKKLEKDNSMLLSDLHGIALAENKSEKLVKKLIATEERLASFIKNTKLITIMIIRKLEKFMNKYRFLRYSIGSNAPHNVREEEYNFFYPSGDRNSEEQFERAKKRGITERTAGGSIPTGDDKLKQSLAALLKIYNLLDTIAKLLKEELVHSQRLEIYDEGIKKGVLVEYKEVYEDYIDTRKYGFEFEEKTIKALKKGTMEETELEKINNQIVMMIKHIFRQILFVKDNLLSKAIGIFFTEFDKIQIGLKKDIEKLQKVFFDEINRNENLAQALLNLEEERKENIQEEFGKFLISMSQRYKDQIHLKIKD